MSHTQLGRSVATPRLCASMSPCCESRGRFSVSDTAYGSSCCPRRCGSPLASTAHATRGVARATLSSTLCSPPAQRALSRERPPRVRSRRRREPISRSLIGYSGTVAPTGVNFPNRREVHVHTRRNTDTRRSISSRSERASLPARPPVAALTGSRSRVGPPHERSPVG